MASDLHVLIIGAGTAGLMLGLLLERADISYEVRLAPPPYTLNPLFNPNFLLPKRFLYWGKSDDLQAPFLRSSMTETFLSVPLNLNTRTSYLQLRSLRNQRN